MAIAHIASRSTLREGGTITGVLVSPSRDCAAGNLLTAWITWDENLTTITTVTDTAGHTWHGGTLVTDSTGTLGQWWYVYNTVAQIANVITVTFSSPAVDTATIFVDEWSGIATASDPKDAQAQAFGIGSSSPISTGAFTTDTANELIVCGSLYLWSDPPTEGTGFTLLDSIGYGGAAEYKIVSAIQTGVTASFVLPTTGFNYAMAAITFRVPSGGGGGGSNNLSWLPVTRNVRGRATSVVASGMTPGNATS